VFDFVNGQIYFFGTVTSINFGIDRLWTFGMERRKKLQYFYDSQLLCKCVIPSTLSWFNGFMLFNVLLTSHHHHHHHFRFFVRTISGDKSSKFQRRTFGNCWCKIFFYRLDVLPATEPTVSKHWRINQI